MGLASAARKVGGYIKSGIGKMRSSKRYQSAVGKARAFRTKMAPKFAAGKAKAKAMGSKVRSSVKSGFGRVKSAASSGASKFKAKASSAKSKFKQFKSVQKTKISAGIARAKAGLNSPRGKKIRTRSALIAGGIGAATAVGYVHNRRKSKRRY